MRAHHPDPVVSMTRLTVVQVLPALESGGVERGTLELGKYLVDQGHRSIVISAGGRLVEQLQREGSEHVTWDLGRKNVWTLRHIPRLRRFLQELQPDILHVRSRMPAWVCYLAWKGMAPGKRPRFITTAHGMYSVNRYSAVMTKGERVIAVSNTVSDYLRSHYPELDVARITVIPRGIDPALYFAGYQPAPEWVSLWQAQYPQLIGKKLLTLPGRITRLKGHEDFIQLIARLRSAGEDVHGLIVGGAETKKLAYLAELKNKVAHSGLEPYITFTGQRSDLREIMAISDLVLSLSTQPESFGRTVLEALSLGRPVLGYDHGGVGEQLRLLFPPGAVAPGDWEALVRQCRTTMALGQITLGSPPPTLENMLASTLDLYESCA